MSGILGPDPPLGAKPPGKVIVFDSTKPHPTEPINLDTLFFEVKRPEYPNCNHLDRGVTLDIGTRKVTCKCGVEMDAFDALLAYAHSERRLVNTWERIQEYKRKEREKKDKKPFARDITGLQTRFASGGRVIGYILTLRCGHQRCWDKKRRPRSAHCAECMKNAKLKDGGVAVIGTQA